MVSEAQRKASKKWREENRERSNYGAKKRNARSFVRVATKEDLLELKNFIDEHLKEL